MPITPFHMGPALAVKAVAPRHFSFLIFGMTQAVIDSEPAFHLLRGDWPMHRFFHTYLGATAIAMLTVIAGRPLLEWVARLWNRLFAPSAESVFRIEPRIPLAAAVSGALIGGYSHVLLDSILYSDVRPFAPLSDGNALFRLTTASSLILGCVALGALGCAALAATYLRRRWAADRAS